MAARGRRGSPARGPRPTSSSGATATAMPSAPASTTPYVAAATAPNATFIDAGIDGLTFGDGGDASLGSSTVALAARAFSPNGDGSKDRLRLRWTNHLAFDSMALRAFRLDGTLAGTRALPDVAVGPQAYDWDGALTGLGAP